MNTKQTYDALVAKLTPKSALTHSHAKQLLTIAGMSGLASPCLAVELTVVSILAAHAAGHDISVFLDAIIELQEVGENLKKGPMQ